ncbi:3-oxoacyl-ACP reductase FabG [Carnobacterium maltaromaticum]|uniref:3-oxoacyl-ACP reductase FabG n=1 Tax=Carnobacterium maltaromaticum TaxID=2751 RepID=UPI00295EC351|nr:3-oxoacyl-ACP reductase FabG [Carnobacterium maltaromaticum]
MKIIKINEGGKMNKKVGVVTGGTEGIGLATSKLLLQKGAHVIITYSKNDEKAERAKKELSLISNDFNIFKSSSSVLTDVKDLSKELKKKFGHIDFLVNNAGISKSKYAISMSEKDWNDVIDVNLTGTFLTTKFLIPLMFKNGGSLVNVSSQVGKLGNIGQVNYAASKAGVIGLTHTIAQEYGKKNIRVNAICPGFVNTEILNEMPEEELKKKIERVILGRLGEVQEIAEVIVFLLSSKSSYINSAVIDVDGGKSF